MSFLDSEKERQKRTDGQREGKRQIKQPQSVLLLLLNPVRYIVGL